TMADRLAGSQPSACSRRSASRRPKPQSTSTRAQRPPSVVSTSSALPSLPLPRLAKRKPASPSVQLFVQQREDLAGRGAIDAGDRTPLGIEHRDGGADAGGLREQLELLRDFLLTAAPEQSAEKAWPAVRLPCLR